MQRYRCGIFINSNGQRGKTTCLSNAWVSAPGTVDGKRRLFADSASSHSILSFLSRFEPLGPVALGGIASLPRRVMLSVASA